jgi:endogenous inhibitor of DNA gyrase (YacG/DUF329 family)
MNASDDHGPERRAKDKKEAACPICGKPANERYDPFCSKRCADVDLHRWLMGNYVIPGQGAARPRDAEDE